MSAAARARWLGSIAWAVAGHSLVASGALAQAPPVLPPPPPPPPADSRPPPHTAAKPEVKREAPARAESKPAPREPPKRSAPDRPLVVEVREVHEVHEEPRDARDPRDLRDSRDEAPPARTGFEVDLRTGVTGPYGTIGDHQAMTDVFAAQLPFEIGLGGRISPYILVGGYAGLAVGGVSSDYANSCRTLGATCASFSARLGAQVQVHLRPFARLDPWLGYGIGYESSSVGGSLKGTGDFGVGYRGIEVARFAAGLDIRVTRVFALGPLVEGSFGAYTRVHKVAANVATDDDVGTSATHGWFTLGARVTFLP